MTRGDKLRDFLGSEAKQLGFDATAVTSPEGLGYSAERLGEFVNKGRHGSMEWLEETLVRRSDPKALFPDCKSIIMLAMSYGPETDPLAILGKPKLGVISVYARNRDYHDVIKGRLKTLSAKLLSRARQMGLDGEVKVFVDTAPVMEKPLAERAGLGWQGKHTNLVSRDFGSWLFLGSIFTTLELEPDESERDHCGSCRACLDICPTDAFPAPYQLDARRCISYLTIENMGPIPVGFRKAIGNRIFGCDDCLAVCPWNKFATEASEAKLASPDGAKEPSLGTFLLLDEAGFRKRFSGSPVKRIGRNRFIRNCLIAAGNSSAPELLADIEPHLTSEDPVISESAAWAKCELEAAQ
ncbi:MAG: tRNA epoxyqueuosine(34) reductase QueG [Rhizobiaceae bacterium]